MLTRDQLQELRASITWGDQAEAKEQAKGDSDVALKHAMFRAAKREGLAAADATLEDFLDSVRLEDLNAVLEHRDPTSPDTAT